MYARRHAFCCSVNLVFRRYDPRPRRQHSSPQDRTPLHRPYRHSGWARYQADQIHSLKRRIFAAIIRHRCLSGMIEEVLFRQPSNFNLSKGSPTATATRSYLDLGQAP